MLMIMLDKLTTKWSFVENRNLIHLLPSYSF